MSNTEIRPAELVCAEHSGRRTQLLEPRDVPLGGPRAMRVRRTLPQRQRSLIGAWCFLDHFGPDTVAESGGMRVPPHPHTGLQTVSWLFSGTVEHRDSAGHHAYVQPGELNLMTAGAGISHSEYSTPDTRTLHGAQLWIALPRPVRFRDGTFEHYAPPTRTGSGWQAQVFLGSLLGSTSPVSTHSPLLGAELRLDPGVTLDLAVDPTHEHGVLVDTGQLQVGGVDTAPDQLAYLPPGAETIRLTAGAEQVRLLFIGGTPFGEQIVMWWNFVGRSHEEIVRFRNAWQAEIEEAPGEATGGPEFGRDPGDPEAPLPAPVLPNVPLRPRGNTR